MQLVAIHQPGPGATAVEWDKYCMQTTVQLTQPGQSMA